ncbi:MAG: thymidylate synthase, partial [Porphyrobacter sp. HL-46]
MASAAIPVSDPAAPHPEQQYLDLMRVVWETGSERVDRTGIGTRSVCGAMLRFDLASGAMPLLTTKRVYWKTATRELLWFLSGDTNIRPLVLQGVKIWNEWPHAHYVRETGEDINIDDFAARIAADAAFAARW